MTLSHNYSAHPAIKAFRTSGIADFLSSVTEVNDSLHAPPARIQFLSMVAQTFVTVAVREMNQQNPGEDNLEVLIDHLRSQIAKAGGL
jgi:hypothetical protein